MQKQKNNKQYCKYTSYLESFKKSLQNILRDFQKNREWADIGNWLYRLQQILTGKSFKLLPQNLNLAKRMAQCLNPILPSGIHSTALKIYTIIFTNFQSHPNLLPLMSIGLFPFFECCSSQLKMQVLSIFQNYFICTSEVLQMLVSLINAILPGLNENNQQLTKHIYTLCDKINQDYGKSWIDGAVWVNILKSPRVRIAGFKYFMKVFKDRQKQKEKQIENKPQQFKKIQPQQDFEKKQQIQVQVLMSDNLLSMKDQPDTYQTHFPNFSTLVMSALCACLNDDSEVLIKRSALDLLISYLKLSNNVIQRVNAIKLVQNMLPILRKKQFSLSRRVYTYLFSQPNIDGVYIIDQQSRPYELGILQEALSYNLELYTNSKIDIKDKQSDIIEILAIIETLLIDHPKLSEIFLKSLAFPILLVLYGIFHSKMVIQNRRLLQFSIHVINKYRNIFIQAIFDKIETIKNISEQQKTKNENEIQHHKIIMILQFFLIKLYCKSQIVQNKCKKSQEILIYQKKLFKSESIQSNLNKEQNNQLIYLSTRIIVKLIGCLQVINCSEEITSIDILKLCILLQKQVQKLGIDSILQTKQIAIINNLLQISSSQQIYNLLIELHPKPTKEMLLPYIFDHSYAITCIKHLLPFKYQIYLEQTEKQQLFKAIFKLLSCYFWQNECIQFIQIYYKRYKITFMDLIDSVQPSQWLIYWQKKQGDVLGGVIRMILNVKNSNPLQKHLSSKWIKQSSQIISKIIDPIFSLIPSNNTQVHQNTEINQIYKLFQIIFEVSDQNFSTFFFIQNQKYLLPLYNYIFRNLDYGDFTIKSASIQFMIFILSKSSIFKEKITIFALTLPKIIDILDTLISKVENQLQNKVDLVDQMDQQIQEKQNNRHEQRQMLQIDLLSYLNLINSCIGTSITQKDIEQSKQLIKLLNKLDLYPTILNMMVQCESNYIRSLYIDFLGVSCQMIAKIDKENTLIQKLVNKIFETLFIMLRKEDITSIEHLIQNKQTQVVNMQSSQTLESKNKKNTVILTRESKSNLNVEAKYTQAIQLWKAVKFQLNFTINTNIKNLPVKNLLLVILESFPLSQLKYYHCTSIQSLVWYENLQEQIQKMTRFKKKVFQIFALLWQYYNQTLINILIQLSDPRILIHTKIDLGEVLKAILKSQKMMEIVQYKNNHHFSYANKNILHYNLQQLSCQNKFNHFLYLYLMYCNTGLMKHKKTSIFLESILKIIKICHQCTHLQTKLWLLEIIYLLSERILLSKQINFEKKYKQQLHEIIKQLLQHLLKVINQQYIFTHRYEIKSNWLKLFSKQEKQCSLFDFIKPFPPTLQMIYHQYKINFKKSNNSDSIKIINDDGNNILQYKLFYKYENLDQNNYKLYLSIATIRIFTKIVKQLLLIIYDQDINKINPMIKDIFISILPLCYIKSENYQLNLEMIAEYMHMNLKEENIRIQLIKNIRKPILQVYMGNDFFKCTKKTLNHWKAIVDYCTQGYDLLGQLLSKQGLFEGIFTKKSQSIRLKIKSFERVCFVIYAGRVDKYQNKLRSVLESLNEVMKQQKPSPALLILILFCIRILFMRLSQQSLNRMFKSIWPGLITLLIQILSMEKIDKNVNLMLAALKVIELVHALQLEQFNMLKWIFMINYFGIRLDGFQKDDNYEQVIKKNSDLSSTSSSTNSKIYTPFKFKPYLTKVLPQHNFKCTFIPETNKNNKYTEISKIKLVVKQSNIGTAEQLKNHAYILMQYLMDLTEKRGEVSKQEIQNLIEGDFISLDDYIFQLK